MNLILDLWVLLSILKIYPNFDNLANTLNKSQKQPNGKNKSLNFKNKDELVERNVSACMYYFFTDKFHDLNESRYVRTAALILN